MTLSLLTACSAGDSSSSGGSASTDETTSTAVATSVSPPASADAPAVTAPVSSAPESAPLSTQSGGSGVMPAVVCMNLQSAQDLIQENGVFFSRSVDATGQGRRQLMDRNWIVVAQTPAPGSPVGEGEAVLSVVKIGESSPC
ncbi:PASTA domain-containing protein [Williamsia sp. CHRR-6]|nr:PASTA domain-containing protein [Williamsia sp. CHRR-6]